MDKTMYLAKIETAMAQYYLEAGISKRLEEAITYSFQAGGKRIRPRLFLETVQAFGVALRDSHYQVAASLEMVHTGSLIHDDLPAMDNDDYRRGRLTNHKQFDEATAILAGDSLFLDPFGLLARTDFSPAIQIQLVKELSDASGTLGMVAGQMLDMSSEGQEISLEQLQVIHANKTGCLLTFPFVAAGLVAEVSDPICDALRQLGQLVGLAFQVRDDILDLTADFEALGKTPQKDLVAQKSTYPALLGLSESRLFLEETLDKALTVIHQIGDQVPFQSQSLKSIIEGLRLDD
ncbi:polyprenyl synthetase family protein [Streptococcus ovuberis]|uniref:Farnesyl diphosphate synthase n=1 Tax=Streptococcus ovuberis TaxID=1936207 RepID=A0A7X6MZH2_9STRE|nr:farnesyl diphosphate synthase [Streptococcus ovuberis]NKZ21255.1 polyprenyl synthetase family protein [Streptococcus ovuberis]